MYVSVMQVLRKQDNTLQACSEKRTLLPSCLWFLGPLKVYANDFRGEPGYYSITRLNIPCVWMRASCVCVCLFG